ncbi:glycosyltransferase family 4 protein [Porphyromonadaceae sp. NP-X]|nr:glycosyltransferase family 4 protein [Porphyromonadaceae sp. NP-X]
MIELREQYGIIPLVLLPSEGGDICKFLKSNNIQYFVSHFYWWVNAEHGLFQYLLNWRKQFINLRRVSKIVHLFDQYSISLVYSNSITINIGYFISRKLGCPHIWHMRESLKAYHFKFSMGNFLSRFILRKGAEKYILISDFLKNYYLPFLPKTRMIRIYNGIDFTGHEVDTNKPTNTFHIAIEGILSEQKNQFDALHALKILIEHYQVKQIQLHFIGGYKEPYFTEIKNYVHENQLENYVEFHGHIDQVDKILHNMHLGLICSENEAFGRVTVEYMRSTMPVITSNSGANPELVKDDINGYLYSIYHPDELAEKIFTFIQSPKKCKQMGINAFYYGKSHFSSEQNTKEIYEVIKKMIH